MPNDNFIDWFKAYSKPQWPKTEIYSLTNFGMLTATEYEDGTLMIRTQEWTGELE